MLSGVMLNVVMLSVVILNVVMLNVVMLNVMAPLEVCCAQVALTTHILKIKCSNPTTGPIRDKIVKNKYFLC